MRISEGRLYGGTIISQHEYCDAYRLYDMKPSAHKSNLIFCYLITNSRHV